MDDHLTPMTSDRGFDHMSPIETERCTNDGPPHVVSVSESSAALGPHIWLRIEGRPLHRFTRPDGLPDVEAGRDGTMSAHLTLDQARQLEEQLAWLRTNHYQNEDDDE